MDYQTLRTHLGEISAQRTVLTHMSADLLTRLTDADIPHHLDGMAAHL